MLGGHSCNFREDPQFEISGNSGFRIRLSCNRCISGAQISRQSCDSKLCVACWKDRCSQKFWNPDLSECFNKFLQIQKKIPTLIDEEILFPFYFIDVNFKNEIDLSDEFRHISTNLIIKLKSKRQRLEDKTSEDARKELKRKRVIYEFDLEETDDESGSEGSLTEFIDDEEEESDESNESTDSGEITW